MSILAHNPTPGQQRPADSDTAAEAFLTANQQDISAELARIGAVLAQGGPLADRICAAMRDAAAGVNHAQHRPWCDTDVCQSLTDVDGSTVHDHYGPTVVEADVTARVEWHPSVERQVEPVVYLCGDADLTPDQARTLAANLLYLASAVESSPRRASVDFR